jgi:polysaccharide pyruvyl transferase WcaK-like protein
MSYRRKIQSRLFQVLRHLLIFWRQIVDTRFGLIKRPYALIIAPAGSGSLGDQAMIQSLATALQNQSLKIVSREVLMPNWASSGNPKAERWPIRIKSSEIDLDRKWLSAIKGAHCVYALGADVIDGRYGMSTVRFQHLILRQAILAGVPAVLCGFSISEKPDPEAVDLFKTLPYSVRICIRDPVSLSRFEKLTSRQALLVSDLAFMLNADLTSARVKSTYSWINSRRRIGRKSIIAINVNKLTCEGWQSNAIVDYWAAVITKLFDSRDDLAVLLLAHDFRGTDSDGNLHARIKSSLDSANRAYVTCSPSQISAAEAKAIVANTDLCITGRMHLAIGALSFFVPTFCFAYAGKFEGLAQHVKIDDLVIPHELMESPENMCSWIMERLTETSFRKRQLEAQIPAVKKMAELNFI